MRQWIMVMVLLVGCAGCGDPMADPAPDFEQASLAYQVTGPDLVFSVEPEYVGVLSWAIGRWNTATGWNARLSDLDSGEPAIPVIVGVPEKEGSCGTTSAWSRAGEMLSVKLVVVGHPLPARCTSELRTLMHELGHAFSGVSARAHADYGLMASVENEVFWIDEESLSFVCERWGCPSPRVEQGVLFPAVPEGWARH